MIFPVTSIPSMPYGGCSHGTCCCHLHEPRDPSRTVLYEVIAAYLETFLASLDADPDAKGLPVYVQREFYDYLQCGILAHGFLRLGCDTCQQELRLPCSCKRRGFCPSCAARRMAQTAAHLVEGVIPWVSTRQWVVSVLIPLRYWMAASQDLTAKVHTIIRTTIAQYDVNQAVKGGVERQQVQPGSVTFIQRFGSALNLNVPYHLIFLEGVYLDRTDQSRKPRFLKVEPPTDSDIADVVQKISRRVIRTLRRLGYLKAGIDDAMATGYDPLRDNEPELARTTAASVTQRIACGERTGQHVRRIGSGFGYEGEHPALTGTRCASVHGFSLHGTPRSQRIGVTSWNACCGTRREALCARASCGSCPWGPRACGLASFAQFPARRLLYACRARPATDGVSSCGVSTRLRRGPRYKRPDCLCATRPGAAGESRGAAWPPAPHPAFAAAAARTAQASRAGNRAIYYKSTG